MASSADPEKLLLAHKWKDFVLAAVQKEPKKELRKGPKKELRKGPKKELKSSEIIGRFKRKSKSFFYENVSPNNHISLRSISVLQNLL